MLELKEALRAYSKSPYNRGKNITMIGAIATSGFLAPFTFEGWTNQEAFLTYITQVQGSITLAGDLCCDG